MAFGKDSPDVSTHQQGYNWLTVGRPQMLAKRQLIQLW